MNKLYLYGALALALLAGGGAGGWFFNGYRWESKYNDLKADANSQALTAERAYTKQVETLLDRWVAQNALDAAERNSFLNDVKRTQDFYRGLQNDLRNQPVAKDGACNPFAPGFVSMWNAGAGNKAKTPD